jgi:hypothetical protein
VYFLSADDGVFYQHCPGTAAVNKRAVINAKIPVLRFFVFLQVANTRLIFNSPRDVISDEFLNTLKTVTILFMLITPCFIFPRRKAGGGKLKQPL